MSLPTPLSTLLIPHNELKPTTEANCFAFVDPKEGNGDPVKKGNRPDTRARLTNKNKFWATVWSQKPGIVPKT